MSRQIEIPLSRLIISFGLIFALGVFFAILNGYYVEESGDKLPLFVYVIALVSLIVGGSLILLFQWKINKVQLEKILFLLPRDEAEILKCLIEHNYRLEQNHLVAYTGYNKVRISRILSKYEQKGIIEKRNMGNTNLVILNLK